MYCLISALNKWKATSQFCVVEARKEVKAVPIKIKEGI